MTNRRSFKEGKKEVFDKQIHELVTTVEAITELEGGITPIVRRLKE